MGDNKCSECGHEWGSRGSSKTRQCPSCKTRKWGGGELAVIDEGSVEVIATGAEIMAISVEGRWQAELGIAWERLRAVMGDSILTERARREYSWWIPLRCMNCGERFRLADMAEEARGSGRCGLCGKSYIRRGQEVLALGTRS